MEERGKLYDQMVESVEAEREMDTFDIFPRATNVDYSDDTSCDEHDGENEQETTQPQQPQQAKLQDHKESKTTAEFLMQPAAPDLPPMLEVSDETEHDRDAAEDNIGLNPPSELQLCHFQSRHQDTVCEAWLHFAEHNHN